MNSPELPNRKYVVFPGAKSVAQRAKELDIEAEAARINQRRDNTSSLRKQIEAITDPYFEGFLAVADEGDAHIANLWQRLSGQGRYRVRWEDLIWGSDSSQADAITRASELLFNRNEGKYPTLRSYTLEFSQRGRVPEERLKIGFGPTGISNLLLSFVNAGPLMDSIDIWEERAEQARQGSLRTWPPLNLSPLMMEVSEAMSRYKGDRERFFINLDTPTPSVTMRLWGEKVNTFYYQEYDPEQDMFLTSTQNGSTTGVIDKAHRIYEFHDRSTDKFLGILRRTLRLTPSKILEVPTNSAEK